MNKEHIKNHLPWPSSFHPSGNLQNWQCASQNYIISSNCWGEKNLSYSCSCLQVTQLQEHSFCEWVPMVKQTFQWSCLFWVINVPVSNLLISVHVNNPITIILHFDLSLVPYLVWIDIFSSCRKSHTVAASTTDELGIGKSANMRPAMRVETRSTRMPSWSVWG